MRVAIVGLGGVSRNFYNWPERAVGRALVQRGHTVTAYGYRYPESDDLRDDEVIDGIRVLRVPPRTWRNPEFLQQLANEPRPDVVHIMHPRNVLAYPATVHYKKLGVPIVYTWNGPFHDEFLIDDREAPYEQIPHYERLIFTRQRATQRLLSSRQPKKVLRNFTTHWPLQQATRWLPLCQHEADILTQHFGIPAERTQVIPHWLDETPFQQPLTTVPGVEGATRPWLLYIGQLTRRKCYDLVVEAMPTIVAAYPAATFLFVSHNPEQRAHLSQLATERGVAGSLRFLGKLTEEEKASLMRQSNVYLFPSRYEGFGLPLLEAMAAGVPLVSTNIPVINETVQDEENGLLTPYNDAPALAAATLRLLGDEGLRQRLVAGGRRTLDGSHAMGRLVSELEAQYALAVEGKVQALPMREPVG